LVLLLSSEYVVVVVLLPVLPEADTAPLLLDDWATALLSSVCPMVAGNGDEVLALKDGRDV
jgi:hypothetical protein